MVPGVEGDRLQHGRARGDLEPTATSGNSSLGYTDGTYTYPWKTEGHWAKRCRSSC